MLKENIPSLLKKFELVTEWINRYTADEKSFETVYIAYTLSGAQTELKNRTYHLTTADVNNHQAYLQSITWHAAIKIGSGKLPTQIELWEMQSPAINAFPLSSKKVNTT